MNCPPDGLCCPVVYERCRDGDTVEVRLPGSAFIWAVRLLDCWCLPASTTSGAAAKRFAEDVLEKTDTVDLRLWVPLPTGRNLLHSLSFDRIVGVIYVSSQQTLNEMLIVKNLASSTKTSALGE